MRVVMKIWVGRWCTVYRVGRWHLHGIYGDVISFSGVLEYV